MTKNISREKVLASLKSRLNDIKKERQKEEPEFDCLAIEVQKIVHIQLSWGGPADGFKLTYSKEGDLLHGVYYKADWNEYEEINLSEDEMNEISEIYSAESFLEC
jgi:hypothetical protein